MLQGAQILPWLETHQGKQHRQAQGQDNGKEAQGSLDDQGTFLPADFKLRQGKTVVVAASPEHSLQSNDTLLIIEYEFYHHKLRHFPVLLQF